MITAWLPLATTRPEPGVLEISNLLPNGPWLSPPSTRSRYRVAVHRPTLDQADLELTRESVAPRRIVVLPRGCSRSCRSIAEPLDLNDEHEIIGRVHKERDQALLVLAEVQCA